MRRGKLAIDGGNGTVQLLESGDWLAKIKFHI
jgi:hypothetical protein